METTMQEIVSLAAAARGLSPSWTNLEAWHKISILAEEFFELTSDLEDTRARCKTELDSLTTHRARLKATISRVKEAADYHSTRFEFDSEAQDEYDGAIGIVDSISEAIAIINDRLRPIEGRIVSQEAKVDKASALLMQQLRAMNYEEEEIVPDSPNVEPFQFSQEIYLPEELDVIEEELAKLDAIQEYREIHGNIMMADPETVQWEREELTLQYAFNDCKQRQTELESGLKSEEEEIELEAVETQIQELGHQLAMRGVPIKDGSVVRYQETADWASDSGASPIQRVQYCAPETNDNPWETQNKPMSENRSTEESLGTTQRGLFGGFELEKPSANQGEGDEALYTQADVARWESKITSWLDDLPDSDHMLEPDTVMPVIDTDESLAVLADIDQEDSITRVLGYAELSFWEQAIVESRRRAWATQLARESQELARSIETESPWITRPPGYESWSS